MTQTSDVVVVGGGMVGALTALAFARCELQVALIEKQDSVRFNPAEHDIRVSAISTATQQMFEAVGAWDNMQNVRVCPYRRMHVWDAASNAKTSFDSANAGHQQLGFIVENGLIQHSLWQQLKTLDNVQIHTSTELTSLEFFSDKAVVVLSNGSQLNTGLVVAADGSRSVARQLAGINTDGESYDQQALVATVTTELPQQDITWQRFTETGPQAFLPLTGNRASMVWYHDPWRIAELKALQEGEFISAMHEEFPERLGRIESVQQTGSFPLSWSHAQQYVKPRFALVGDAAHSVHPLAGQGVNLGMLDAAVLVECVMQQFAKEGDTGSLRALRRYERWRKPSNELMIRMLDGIQQAFQPQGSAVSKGLLQASRSAALFIADRVGPVNKTCMRAAMGLAGELPQMATGRLPLATAA